MIVVTGANGFIGSAVVWQLNEAGYKDIVCVDSVNLKTRPQLLENKSYQAFYSKSELVDELKAGRLKGVKWIIHMGACSSTTEMNLEFLKENNTEYTKTLFNWCLENQVPYIYASSGAVYGSGEKGFSDETMPEAFSPLNPYGRSKWEFDCWVLKQKSTPKHWYGLRFFNVYGPNEYFKGDMASVVFKAFHQIKNSKSLKLFKSYNKNFGDGKQMRDFIYVKDITRWILEIMNKPIASGIYNMGAGTARTWLDLSQAVFTNMKINQKIDWIEMPESIRNQYQYFTEAKMEKLWNEGISQPSWPLEKGIEDYVKNYLIRDQAVL